MSYISVCSGIEAATVAWNGLGWQPLAFAEIEPFPSAVLEHHYPEVRNFGDFTTIQESDLDRTVDLIVGGTPCQSFSVAGRRAGLDDPRGNLTLEFVRLCNRIRPTWILWENVPGVLSIDSGRTFATILQTLGQCGYQCAWRILDAQHFGVPQRRRRLFLVGHLGDWRRAAEVLFEPESLSGDIAPTRETRKAVAGTPERSDDGNGGGLIAPSVTSKWAKGSGGPAGDECQNLVLHNSESVRRLTPAECERLQGFSGTHTRISWRGKSPDNCPDGPRYKAIGNSMAVPVVRWLGERIQREYE